MIGIFGGSFDPVHVGHLRLAMDLADELQLSAVRFVPAASPPHRGGLVASPEHRAAMLELAVQDIDGFSVDRCEFVSGASSYTVDTLASIKKTTNEPLVFMLGGDSFAALASWHRWQDLFDLAHIAVMQRPGSALPVAGAVADQLTSSRAQAHHKLHECPSGKIFVSESSLLDISSTRVRAMLAAKQNPRYLLPDAVLAYLIDHELY